MPGRPRTSRGGLTPNENRAGRPLEASRRGVSGLDPKPPDLDVDHARRRGQHRRSAWHILVAPFRRLQKVAGHITNDFDVEPAAVDGITLCAIVGLEPAAATPLEKPLTGCHHRSHVVARLSDVRGRLPTLFRSR